MHRAANGKGYIRITNSVTSSKRSYEVRAALITESAVQTEEICQKGLLRDGAEYSLLKNL